MVFVHKGSVIFIILTEGNLSWNHHMVIGFRWFRTYIFLFLGAGCAPWIQAPRKTWKIHNHNGTYTASKTPTHNHLYSLYMEKVL